MNKHTPGPWGVCANPTLARLNDDGQVEDCDEIQNMETGETVCYVPLAVIGGEVAPHGHANTRLIAAAPRMLMLIQAFAKWEGDDFFTTEARAILRDVEG